ncbi:MAG: hypothetical protein DDG59_04960 [Anaerolineae bacterium]|nr:MAG: hypothetical protein DDG59_04960 [Anaerolineae bacterium]
MALALSRPLFWLAIALVLVALFRLARKGPLRWLPAFFLRAALLLALIAEFFSVQQQGINTEPLPLEVLIVDQSDSIDANLRKQFEQQALQWKNSAPNRLIIAAGEDAYVVGDAFRPDNGKATYLENAFDLALELLENNKGRIILASDGNPSNPLVLEERVRQLQEMQIPMDTIPLDSRQAQHDVYLGQIVTPKTLWAKTTFSVFQEVVMPEQGTILLELKVNEEVVSSQSLTLEAGNHWIEFPLDSKEAGILTLESKVSYSLDEWEGNNQAFAVVQVFDAPRALLLTQYPEQVRAFARNLQSEGIDIEIMSPGELSTSETDLGSYQVVILHNLLATNLTTEQLATLRSQVVDRGQGLVLTGGINSLTLGGYLDTPLEAILPVKLEPPPRNARLPLAFVIMLDASGSMGTKKDDNPEPIVLAGEAAARTIEGMQAQDYFGLLTFSTTSSWKVSIRLLGDGLEKRLTMDEVARLRAYGGTKLFAALQDCFQGMLKSDPPVEHKNLLILSDGKSSDGKFEDFVNLTKEIRQAGWTVSVVSFGDDVEEELLTAIAKAGNGRYHHVKDASELPRVMIAESKAASGENIQAGTTTLAPGDNNHPILGGFASNEFPTIETYNAVTSRQEEGSEDILISSNFGDPILSAWQVGLGRVIVWATDIGGDWSPKWGSWSRLGQFWLRIIRYALPDPSFGLDRATVQLQPSNVLVTAYLAEIGQTPPSNSSVTYILTRDDTVYQYPLLPIEPETYQVELSIEETGVYLGAIQYQRDGVMHTLAVPFVVNYPEEWKPNDGELGTKNLSKWAVMSGGSVRTELPSSRLAQDTTAESTKMQGNWSRMLLILLVAWPIEIAIRRRWMPWR